MAAPLLARRPRSSGSISAALTNGRAASCTSTTSARRRRPRRRARPSPAGARRRPPRAPAHGHGAARHAGSGSRCPAGRATTTSSTRGMPAQAPRGCARASTARRCRGTAWARRRRVGVPEAAGGQDRAHDRRRGSCDPPCALARRRRRRRRAPPCGRARAASSRGRRRRRRVDDDQRVDASPPSPSRARSPRSGCRTGPRSSATVTRPADVHGVLADAVVGFAVATEPQRDRARDAPRDRRRRRAAATRASTGSRRRPARSRAETDRRGGRGAAAPRSTAASWSGRDRCGGTSRAPHCVSAGGAATHGADDAARCSASSAARPVGRPCAPSHHSTPGAPRGPASAPRRTACGHARNSTLTARHTLAVPVH